MNKWLKQIFTVFIGICSVTTWAKTIVVIDAGHGGKDPGAIGTVLGVKEKEVTLSIAKELQKLLNADSNFRAVMTRNGDNFVQLPQRTEIARKNKAHYLVSIHADSSPSSSAMKGASVWVLSNRRASDEMGKWLEDHEKQSELLGGAGSILANTNERYLNQTVLDLQFSHAQRKGYEMGKSILSRLNSVTGLAKANPQHASLSVLRSPDIISILVETGFLSNPSEEQKLANLSYRKQIARAIYQGLVDYRRKNSSASKSSATYKEAPKVEKAAEKKVAEKNSVEKPKANDNKRNNENKKEDKSKSTEKKTEKTVNKNATHHIVAENETLYRIALMYGTTPAKLSELNNIKNNNIRVGQKLKLR